MKKLVLVLCVFVCAAVLYAQDDDNAISFFVGTFSNHDFVYGADDTDSIGAEFKAGLEESLGRRVVLNKFFIISDEDEDTEDAEVVEYVINYKMPDDADEGDTFGSIVFRNIDEKSRGMDGWFIYTRYSRKGGWSYFIYYFSIRVIV